MLSQFPELIIVKNESWGVIGMINRRKMLSRFPKMAHSFENFAHFCVMYFWSRFFLLKKSPTRLDGLKKSGRKFSTHNSMLILAFYSISKQNVFTFPPKPSKQEQRSGAVQYPLIEQLEHLGIWHLLPIQPLSQTQFGPSQCPWPHVDSWQ